MPTEKYAKETGKLQVYHLTNAERDAPSLGSWDDIITAKKMMGGSKYHSLVVYSFTY